MRVRMLWLWTVEANLYRGDDDRSPSSHDASVGAASANEAMIIFHEMMTAPTTSRRPVPITHVEFTRIERHQSLGVTDTNEETPDGQ